MSNQQFCYYKMCAPCQWFSKREWTTATKTTDEEEEQEKKITSNQRVDCGNFAIYYQSTGNKDLTERCFILVAC